MGDADDGGFPADMDSRDEDHSLGADNRCGQSQDGSDSGEGGSEEFYEPDLMGLDDDGYDDFQGGVLNEEGGAQDFEVCPPVGGGGGGGGAEPSAPGIEEIHTKTESYADSKTVEGRPENLRENTKAAGSEWYPWKTKEQQMLWIWQHQYQISRKALGGLLNILLMEDEGKFDVRGLAGVDPEHFNSRMRPYLPLLELVERQVKSTRDGETTAAVYDIPVNLLIHRTMQLQSEMELSETFAGGKILRGEEAEQNSLTSDHLNCVPTRPVENVRRSNHHGTLARSSPFFGIDGIRATYDRTKVYINDCCVCNVGGSPALCRILGLFYDETRREVLVPVRMFRLTAEVRAVGGEEKLGGMVRAWEDVTPGSEIELKAADVLALAEIFTAAEVAAGQHNTDGDQPERSTPWERFVGEGFVKKAGNSRRKQGDSMPRSFAVSQSPWCREGTTDNPLFSLRSEGIHLNDLANLPFLSVPLTWYNDAFNYFDLTNKVSET